MLSSSSPFMKWNVKVTSQPSEKQSPDTGISPDKSATKWWYQQPSYIPNMLVASEIVCSINLGTYGIQHAKGTSSSQ